MAIQRFTRNYGSDNAQLWDARKISIEKCIPVDARKISNEKCIPVDWITSWLSFVNPNKYSTEHTFQLTLESEWESECLNVDLWLFSQR